MSHRTDALTDGSRLGDGALRKRARVLVLDDDLQLAQTLKRVLTRAYDVVLTTDAEEAIRLVDELALDVIVSDVMMPGVSGVDFLQRIHARRPDVPVILLTGNPTAESAASATTMGAFAYLAKPIHNAELVQAVGRAANLHRLARARSDAAALTATSGTRPAATTLDVDVERCLRDMWMAFQPIVDTRGRKVLGYEAFMRCREVPAPPEAILLAAEKAGRLQAVGQRVRSLCAEAFRTAPGESFLFVNLHASDVLDGDLYDRESGLAQVAERVVLEIPEGSTAESIPDLSTRIRRLKAMGFRIALDDLGAGRTGFSIFTEIEPDFVKLDISLVREVHQSATKQSLIRQMTQTCTALGMRVLAEGIESVEERDAVAALGCTDMQGYFFARPGDAFPGVIVKL